MRRALFHYTICTVLALAFGGALAAADPEADLVARGEYLARAGDCAACHTTEGGAAFAGGFAMLTPIGQIYSSNITPDPDTGIGSWSYEDFANGVRKGTSKRGYTLYPAMPYPSYSRVTDDDMRALYAYFMHGVAPVHSPNRKSDIHWPLSVRFPLAMWRWMFAPKPTPFAAAASTPELARGAYLVEGLGHCGACHTPRALTMQEKALSDRDGTLYLAGGSLVDGWMVPSLRNENGGGLAAFSAADIAALLKQGRNQSTATFGGMNDVIVHSTQYLTDADLMAIATYLKQLAPHDASVPPYKRDDSVSKALYAGVATGRGAQLYVDRCAGCHRSDGQGYAKAFPALAGNPVLQADPEAAIKIVLGGGAQPATDSAPSSLTMAPYAALMTDEEVADVVTFIQTAWGNRGKSATSKEVGKMRKHIIPMAVLKQ
jgi:alcohol dehydrogenase (quinone), cytochrome c subunit